MNYLGFTGDELEAMHDAINALQLCFHHKYIVVYSTDEREGFLTKKGIEQIRSGFANDIYQYELHHLYARQTEVRDLLKKESAELMQQLSAKVQRNTSFEPELCQMIQLCQKQLQESKGKKYTAI